MAPCPGAKRARWSVTGVLLLDRTLAPLASCTRAVDALVSLSSLLFKKVLMVS